MIKSIIFDFDGVIVASEGLGRKTVLEVLKEENLLEKMVFDENGKITNNGKQIRPGTSIHDVLNIVFPKKGDYLFEKWYEKFDKDYLNNVNLLNGAKETINSLNQKGIKLFVVSTKYKSLIVKALNHFEIDHYFDFVVGRETIDPPKPSNAPFKLLKEKFKIEEENTIYIGDTHTDELFAQNCNIKFIFFESNVEKSVVSNYYKKITNFTEIEKIVSKLNKFN